jgi:primosomal protein N' (replication factor Y) (superfamily II helicase)
VSQQKAKHLYVQVILPLALPGTFTYHVPDELQQAINVGQRVVVQFGKQKIYSALVWNISGVEVPSFATKPVISIIDELPVITASQMELWKWMADYYLCTIGEVMAAALPSALKLQSETKIQLHPDFNKEQVLADEREYIITEALLNKKQLSIAEVSRLLSLKQVMPVIKSLLSRNVIEIAEEMVDKYKPRYAAFVRLSEKADDEEFMRDAMQSMERKSPKQLDLLLFFMRMKQDEETEMVSRTLLLKRAKLSAAVLQALVKKEILEIVEMQTDRLTLTSFDVSSDPLPLNDAQEQCKREISDSFLNEKVVLLHGVTSSGKTEIYIHLLKEVIDKGQQAIYLVPEIALTSQVITRLRKHFGSKLLVYHSRFSDNERVETWNKVLSHRPGSDDGQLIIGARSAVFLPLSNAGLFIVDEEHDNSYKQTDPSPRYHARDTAVWMGNTMKAPVLLGSATPSLESYYNALAGKYILTSLNTRYGEMIMPEVTLVDVKDALKRKQMHSHFSGRLIEMMKQSLEKGEQVILFQNRRGFAPVLECRNCSWVPHCINCDVSLTLHKQKQEIRCHYCGYSTSPPSSCNACGSNDLRMKGFGTEKIEEELQLLMPGYRISRLDHDTARSKKSFHQIISDFDNGDIDVLVGTQMVTKGLDFKNVSLVGILNADQLLNYPDFRSHERAFQLMEQVSGRAGRKKVSGKVVIQTYNTKNIVLQYVIEHDFRGFYNHELIERNKFNYPPYFRLIECSIKHRDEAEAERAARLFGKELTEVFGKRVLGPTQPNVARIRNLYIRQILIKLERKLSVMEVKKKLQKAIDFYRKEPANRNVILNIDVDPY